MLGKLAPAVFESMVALTLDALRADEEEQRDADEDEPSLLQAVFDRVAHYLLLTRCVTVSTFAPVALGLNRTTLAERGRRIHAHAVP